jgi:hypothetical protein
MVRTGAKRGNGYHLGRGDGGFIFKHAEESESYFLGLLEEQKSVIGIGTLNGQRHKGNY